MGTKFSMMKRLIRFSAIIFAALVVSCTSDNLESLVYSDNLSRVVNYVDSTKIHKIKKVLIFGNSIVKQGPQPEIGWTSNWGMAASRIDSDFVHLLIKRIQQEDSLVIIKYENIADFESHFISFSLSDLDSFRNPDMFILRISENVNEKMAVDSNFLEYYDKLVRYIDSNHNSVNVIVDGFWKKPSVNGMVLRYAIENKLPFITTTDLSADPSNEAGSRFADAGVAAHPSDRGMRKIADRIWAYIKAYF